MYTKFPSGLIVENFFTQEYCNILKEELVQATWIPALVSRYEGSEHLGIEHDSTISTALVTKGYKFNETIFDKNSIFQKVHNFISERFDIVPDSFSEYGISRYPEGSKLSLHADTGVYNTKRLITCIIYIESAINGGDICFPEANKEISVEKGMLLCFYSELKHEVREIISGERIALVFFAEAI